MEWNEFIELATNKSIVVLLEGRRNVLTEDRSKLVSLGKMLAERLPLATFRSGNAEGSDQAFAEGVASVNAERIQLITPSTSHRLKYRPEGAYSVSLDEVLNAEEPEVYYETSKKATPKNERLVDYFQTEPDSRNSAKARYLIRDTVKVLGSNANGLQPTSIGLFYTDAKDKYAGGTGHTIRVCEQNNVPVITQIDWFKWLIS